MNKKTWAIKFIAVGLIVLSNLFDASAQQSKKFETRCGWLSNPTPFNFSLYDRESEWIISVQSGYQVEGFEAPDFKDQWIDTNNSYGYGCACLNMTVDKETSRVLAIRKSSARPLSACQKDKALRKWKSVLE